MILRLMGSVIYVFVFPGALAVKDVDMLSSIPGNPFFDAVKPSGCSKLLDHYKVHGDLLHAFHMTREDDKKTYVFRRQFDVTAKKEVCRSVYNVLEDFLDFLNRPCVLVGTEEQTVTILINKMKKLLPVKFGKVEKNLKGYSYWKRMLQHLKMEEIEVGEYYQNIPQKNLAPFLRAHEVAMILRISFEHALLNSNKSNFSMKRHCRYMKDLNMEKKHTVEENDEKVEIVIRCGFRGIPFDINCSATKLEEMLLSSEDEGVNENLNNRSRSVEEYCKNNEDSIVISSEEEANIIDLTSNTRKIKNETYSTTAERGVNDARKILREKRFKRIDEEMSDDFVIDSVSKKLYSVSKLNEPNRKRKLAESSVPKSPLETSKHLKSSSKTTFSKYDIFLYKGLIRCHMCNSGCKPENIDKHYSNHHRAHRWCQAEKHPGNPTFESNGCGKFCLLCDVRTYHGDKLYKIHLVKYHRIHIDYIKNFLESKDDDCRPIEVVEETHNIPSMDINSNKAEIVSNSSLVQRPNATKKASEFTKEQILQIRKDSVDEKIPLTDLSLIWDCTADTVRDLVNAGTKILNQNGKKDAGSNKSMLVDKTHREATNETVGEKGSVVPLLGDNEQVRSMVSRMQLVSERNYQFSFLDEFDCRTTFVTMFKCNLCISNYRDVSLNEKHASAVHKTWATPRGPWQAFQKMSADQILKRICACHLPTFQSSEDFLAWSEKHLQNYHKIENPLFLRSLLLQIHVNAVRFSIKSDPFFTPNLSSPIFTKAFESSAAGKSSVCK